MYAAFLDGAIAFNLLSEVSKVSSQFLKINIWILPILKEEKKNTPNRKSWNETAQPPTRSNPASIFRQNDIASSIRSWARDMPENFEWVEIHSALLTIREILVNIAIDRIQKVLILCRNPLPWSLSM